MAQRPASASLGAFRAANVLFVSLIAAAFWSPVDGQSSVITANVSQTYACDRPNTYPIDFAKVYQLDWGMPQSCTCMNSQATESSCTEFECECTCDLTAGLCDYNCCCDPDCSVGEVTRFQESEDGCLPEGPARSVMTMCTDVERVNERYPMTYTGTVDKQTSPFLCVAYDNSDIKGIFHNDPGTFEGDTTVFDDSRVDSPYAYEDYFPGSAIIRRSDQSYYRGDFISARQSTSGRRVFGGALPLPTAGPDGGCLESNYAQFMEPVRTGTCSRFDADLPTSCSSTFNPARFVDLEVCAQYDFYSSCTSWVPVELGTVTLTDPAGAVVAEQTTLPGTSYANSTCSNALVSTCYTVYASKEGEITRVVVDLTLRDLVATAEISSEQAFTLEFGSSDRSSPDAAPSVYGNTILRTKSGNPGYIEGMPVLFGQLAVDGQGKQAIKAQIPGLQVYGSAASVQCDLSNPRQIVNFGEDFVSGCVLSVSHAEFVDMCSSQGPYMTTVGPFENAGTSGTVSFDPKVPTFLAVNGSAFYVGEFGNADPLDTSQWLQVRVVGLAAEPEFANNDQYVCNNLVTSVKFRFLTKDVGEKGNPQPKIIGAEMEYATENVVFAAEDTETQNIGLTTTVSFVPYIDDTLKTYSPPPPPVLFSVPSDVFYPFYAR